MRNITKLSLQAVLASTALLMSVPTFAVTLNEQRNTYSDVIKKLQQKQLDESTVKQMEALKNYPLYPYAKRLYLSQQINNISGSEINLFLETYKNIPDTKGLKKNYIEKLIKEQNWPVIVQLLHDGNRTNVTEECRYYYAQYQLGKTDLAMKGANELWLSEKDRPSECNVLFNLWMNQKMTENDILLRLELVMHARNTKLARYVIDQLPERYTTLRSELNGLLSNPTKLTQFAKRNKVSGFSHSVIHAIFPQFAKQNPALAKEALSEIVAVQKIKKPDEIELEKHIAAALFKDNITPSQKAWRDAYLKKYRPGDLIEKHLRSAIAEADYTTLAAWLSALSDEDKQREEWQYWQAKVLLKQGKKDKANTLFKALTLQRGYYPLLSAQQISVAYPVAKIQETVDLKKSVKAQIDTQSEIQRIRELMYFNDTSAALQEWLALLDGKEKSNIEQFSRYAYEKNWGLLSIQATIAGKLWNHFQERLPILYQPMYKAALNGKKIPISYAMAITRQESAYNPAVASSAGARGLMQLMPATAKETAKKAGLNAYKNSSQLFDPLTNIQLGSSYLDMMYNRFENNRVLSSIAYNAGPGRVPQWLARSNGRLSVDEFIESIPFNETRGYVKNVLFYDYMYRYFMKQQPKTVLTAAEFKRKY